MTRHIHRWLPAAVAIVATFAVPAESRTTLLKFPEIRVATARRGSARYTCFFGVNRARDRSQVECSGRGGRVLRRADLVRTSDGATLATAAVSGRSFTIPIPNPTAAAIDALLEGGLRIRLFSRAALVAQGTFNTPARGVVWTRYLLSLAGAQTIGPIQTTNGSAPSGDCSIGTIQNPFFYVADCVFWNHDPSRCDLTLGNNILDDFTDGLIEGGLYAQGTAPRNVINKIRRQNTVLNCVGDSAFTQGSARGCHDGPTTLCLNDNRFRIEVDWRGFTGPTRAADAAPSTGQAGLLYFLDPDNWEVLVKVLDRCGNNNHYWVFAAAATNVEYTLRVTDTAAGQTRSYGNPLGTQAEAITDTSAFATCP